MINPYPEIIFCPENVVDLSCLLQYTTDYFNHGNEHDKFITSFNEMNCCISFLSPSY